MVRRGFLLVVVLLVVLVVTAVLLGVDFHINTAAARDWVIIIYGVMSVVLIVMLILVIGLILQLLKSIRHTITDLVDEIRPTLSELHRTAENVRGTSEFIADTTVSPLIRMAAITRGVRRGISSITGIRARRK
jgi:ABC-type transport system involved in multi-copper enzyme maturation permease subunit